MGLSPPFDRDGKVICSQQYDLDILGVVEKWGISYSPKMIHSGNVMDKMMMNQKKKCWYTYCRTSPLSAWWRYEEWDHPSPFQEITHEKDTTPVLSLTSDETSRTENEEIDTSIH